MENFKSKNTTSKRSAGAHYKECSTITAFTEEFEILEPIFGGLNRLILL